MTSTPSAQKLRLQRRVGFLLLGLSGLAWQPLAGCGRGLMDGNGQVVASASVSPQGGEVRLGQASLQAPAGALEATTEITVERQRASDSTSLGDVYQFSPEGLTFALPVTLRLPSPPDENPGLGLWSNDEWEAVPGSHYDAQAGAVVGSVAHFSKYCAVRLCASTPSCRTGHECRLGVCQPPRSRDAAVADAATGGRGESTGGQGGSSSGGAGGQGGATGGTGLGTGGTAGLTGSGGSDTGGRGGTAGAGTGGVGGKGTGGAASGGSGGTGNCPATQPPVVDATCPNPPATCDYGSTRCVCAVGRVWSCGPIGTGGTGGAGTGGTGTGGSGTGGTGTGGANGCLSGSESVACKVTGQSCEANAECATKYCSGSTGTTCPSGTTCTCATKANGVTCNANSECLSDYCSGLSSSGSGCPVDNICSCAGKPCTSNADCPSNAGCRTASNATCTTGATCACRGL